MKKIALLIIVCWLNIHCVHQNSGVTKRYVSEVRAISKSEKIIHSLIQEKKIPGLAIVVTRKDSLIWKAGYGYANVRQRIPVDPDETFFRIASISKTLSAVGLAKMYENGTIALDSSLYNYVPDFPKKRYDFTIRQLASHTAGIRSYKGNEFLSRRSRTIKDGLNSFAKDSLLYKPGKGYLYNSNDWNLISVAMENASGEDFETYMKDSVFTPLHLSKIIADKSQGFYNKAVFYSDSKRRKRFRRAPYVNNYYKLASGGFLATATDIADFGNEMLYGDFLQPKTKKEMLTMTKVNDKPKYYGLGWEVSYDNKHRPYYGHVGNGVGGYGYFYVYPKEEMVFVILMNVTNPHVGEEIQQIIDNLITSEHLRG